MTQGADAIGRQSVRAGLINVGSQAISVALQLLSTVILARLISPESYGTVGMVMTITAFASLFQDLGLSAATVQRAEITPAQSTALFWMNVAVAAVITVILIACAPFIAAFFHRPELVAVTAVLAVGILLTSFGAQHAALLTRDMKFGYLAIARLAGSVAQFVAALLAALAGLQYWALVIGLIALTVVNVALLWFFSSWRPGLPSRASGVRGMIHYGLNLTAFDFVNYFSRNLDNILIGRVWGAESLGYYTRAYSLLLFPINNIRAPVVAVAMPALSRLQDEPEAFRGYYCRLLGVLAFATMPLASYCFVCADQIVHLLLGPKWAAAAEIAKWLAVSSFLQPVAGLFGVVLMAKGLAKRHLRCGAVAALVVTIAFVLGVTHGPVAMSKYYAAAQYLIFVPIFIYASRDTGIRIGDFFRGVYRQAIGALVAGGATALLRLLCPVSIGIQGLVVTSGFFAAVFLAFYIFVPGGAAELMYYKNAVRGGLIRGKAAPV
jgi:PST family polysaccharide transporter